MNPSSEVVNSQLQLPETPPGIETVSFGCCSTQKSHTGIETLAIIRGVAVVSRSSDKEIDQFELIIRWVVYLKTI